MTTKKDISINNLRIDKWLWVTRFYKTRGLASEAIKGGKIDINETHAKPSKTVQINDRIKIKKSPFTYEITVKGLSKHRGSASIAVTLYEESEDSIIAREKLSEQLKAESALRPTIPGRPSKRDRRNIIRFTRKG